MEHQKRSLLKEFAPTICLIFLCCLIMIATTAYAIFTYQRSGREKNTITTANLNVLLDDHGNPGIKQVGAFPVYDEVGRKTDPYPFTIKNLGTIAVNYKLKLVPDEKAINEDGCSNNLLPDESLKIQLIKDKEVILEDLISNLDEYEIDSGFLGLEEGINKFYSYELRIWIHSESGAEIMNRHYHGRVDIEIIDSSKIN